MTIETERTGEGQPQAAPKTAKVAVLYTSAPTVVPDIGRAMRLAGFTDTLDKTATTALKVNISWQHCYPACSSTPWQIEGVTKALREEGYNDIIAAHNGTVVVDSHSGEIRNKHKAVQDKFLAVGADLVPPELQTSKGFGDYIRNEYAASAQAAKIANLKPE